jgi:hypothetical protein
VPDTFGKIISEVYVRFSGSSGSQAEKGGGGALQLQCVVPVSMEMY